MEEAKEGRPIRTRLPVTPYILSKVYSILQLNPHSFDNIMLWAAFVLCFFGFLRSGEVTIPNASAYDSSAHLSFSDIAVNSSMSPSVIQVTLKASKTDPFRKGVTIYIGKTDNFLCPVSALLNYVSIRGSSPGILFRFKDNSPLTKCAFVSHFRRCLHQAGIDCSQYAGHSFRIGAASTASARGVEDSIIQTLGRWKSAAYLTYIRIPSDNLAALSQRIA